MRFDIRQKRVRPKIYLAKPNETTIARLSEARQETEIFRGGQLNELSFVLPLKHQTLEENKANIHAQMVRERMLIKLVKGEEKRYYIISNLSFDNDSKLVTVSAKSRGYSLSDIPIKGFTTIDNEHPDGLDYSSWTLSEIVRATIDRDEDTPWKLGDVDVDFDLKRREFSFDGSLGELTLSVAEKFGAIVEYDDVNFLIHFRHPDKVGVNRGLRITERNYLKTLNKETNSDSMVTQMSLYGKDGLTIHEISPTGSPYIEDFSHFLYPYKESKTGAINPEKIKSGNISVFNMTDLKSIREDVLSLRLNTVNVPLVVHFNSTDYNDMQIPQESYVNAQNIINHLSDLNLKIIVEPYPLVDNGDVSETEITPSNIDLFFWHWKTNVLSQVADFASMNDAYAMYVSSNMAKVEYATGYWKDMIAYSKTVFSGKIMYRTNFWTTAVWSQDTIDSYNQKLFNSLFDDVDYIAISAYFELNEDTDVTSVEQLEADLMSSRKYGRNQNIYQEVKNFFDVHGKKVLFGELGFASRLGAASEPWNDLLTASSSEELQKNLYTAYHNVFHDEEWFVGFSTYSIGDRSSTYSTFGKQAEKVISEWFAESQVVQSSYFMSDSLAKAMVAYNNKITLLSPDFEDFLTQLDGLMDDIRELEDSISNKKIELTQKQEQIDIYLALHNGSSDATLESEKQTIQTAINTFQSSVDSLKGEVELIAGADYYDLGFIPVGVQGGQLGLLKEQMLVRNNFTPEQIAERSHFIIRKEWSNDAITDVRDLMEEGKKALKEAIKPSISMTTSVVNFLNIVESDVPIEEMYMWDTIRVEQPWNKEVAEAKVIAFTVNHDTQELSLEIANIKDNNNGVNEFLSMLYQSSFAATVVNENRYKWDLSKENNGQINALIEQNFDAVKKKVSGGVAGLTEFSNRGLISRDYEDQNKYLVIQNGILATTNNNGVTWGHAITPTGIVAERLYGKVIAGVNLTIEDRDGIFRILGNKASVSNRLGEEVVKLGLISNEGETERFGFVVDNRKNQVGIVDGEGFYISRYQNGSLEKLLWTDANGNLNAQKITATSMTVVGGDLASAVVKNSQGIPVVSFGSFGMTVEGGSIAINGGTNGIRLNNSEGLVSENTKTLVTLNATSGMKIRNKSTSQDVFWIDTNGKLNVRDIVINSGSITWGSVNSQPMPNTSWDSLQGKPTYLGSDRIWSPLIQGGTIESGTFSSGTITGNTITGGTISGTTITGTTISGNTISGGSISGTTITGSSSISIGKFSVTSSGTILVGSSSNGYELASDGLFFQKSGGLGYLYSYGSSMELYSSGNLNLSTGSGSVRVNSSNIATESWVSNNYAGKYHSHSEYITSGSSTYFSSLGVGGSYQNSTNPSNTSIGANNIFVPNAVYAKGVALTSSVVYKTNIKPLPDGALSVVNDVNIYEYHYQKDIDELNFENKQIGVLAEAVPAILRGGENKSVNAYAMTSILWKAVQEQQQMIQTLETRIAELEEIQ